MAVAERRKRIAKRIKELQPGASNRAIADALGVSRTTIEDWLRQVSANDGPVNTGDSLPDARRRPKTNLTEADCETIRQTMSWLPAADLNAYFEKQIDVEMPVSERVADDAVLFLWTTSAAAAACGSSPLLLHEQHAPHAVEREQKRPTVDPHQPGRRREAGSRSRRPRWHQKAGGTDGRPIAAGAHRTAAARTVRQPEHAGEPMPTLAVDVPDDVRLVGVSAAARGMGIDPRTLKRMAAAAGVKLVRRGETRGDALRVADLRQILIAHEVR